jgi:hypothetical protein
MIIYEDNQGCIELGKNPKHHERMKHMDIKYHFVSEKVRSSWYTLRQASSWLIALRNHLERIYYRSAWSDYVLGMEIAH